MTSAPDKRVVLDTNVLISAAILPHSTPAQALRKALGSWHICISDAAADELREVLRRPRFDRYFAQAPGARDEFLDLFESSALRVEVTQEVADCVDPKDNKFLSLALAAKARLLVSGDRKHLLGMDPYQGVRIVTAAGFLAEDG